MVRAIQEPIVGERWDEPSVLEDQTIGSLAGHLARGAVWVVDDYLADRAARTSADFDSPAHYFVGLLSLLGDADHQAIRDRGAAIAAAGHQAVVDETTQRLEALGPRVRGADPQQLIAVAAGKVLRLDHYLVTRVVEQVVHLDDLARSLERAPFDYPEEGRALAIETGMAMAVLRAGSHAVVRGLYRAGFSGEVVPVL